MWALNADPLLSLNVLLLMHHAYSMWWNKGTIQHYIWQHHWPTLTVLQTDMRVVTIGDGCPHPVGAGVNLANPFRQIKHCFSLPSPNFKNDHYSVSSVYVEGKSLLFFCHTPKKWGVRYPPVQKVGVRIPPVLPVNYAYARTLTMWEPSVSVAASAICRLSVPRQISKTMQDMRQISSPL